MSGTTTSISTAHTHLHIENETHSTANETDYEALALALFSKRAIIGPQTDTERKVHDIWSQLLNLTPDQLSIVDSFFDLGGDSLKAGLLVSTMRKKLGTSTSVADLLSAPTIGMFSVYVFDV